MTRTGTAINYVLGIEFLASGVNRERVLELPARQQTASAQYALFELL